jgi:glutamate racemase
VSPEERPIGIFDSGVGGLSVWREIVRQLPNESTLYVADQRHIPYGPKPKATLVGYSEAIVRFLLTRGCKAIVVACNSASAAALKNLRAQLPEIPFVGMEPAVKPAAEKTESRVVVVLATPATLQGELFTATAERYAHGIRVVAEPCPGLVEAIEGGRTDGAEIEGMLRGFLAPGLAAGADHVVLACTHYPFVIDVVRRIAGPTVRAIDPAPAVAAQLGRVLEAQALRATTAAAPSHTFFTTASPDAFSGSLQALVGVPAVAQPLVWDESEGALREA